MVCAYSIMGLCNELLNLAFFRYETNQLTEWCSCAREVMQRNDQFGIVLLIVLIVMDAQFQTGF